MTDNGVSITAGLAYRDPRRAMDWLHEAFGFKPTLIVTEPSGAISIIMMEFAGCRIEIGQASEGTAQGGVTLHVRGRAPGAIDIHAHCERARAAGAKILQEPAQAFWGDFDYAALDIEGYYWRFGQHIEGAGGRPPKGWKIELDRE